MKAVYQIGVVQPGEKGLAAGILANIYITDDRLNKWCLGKFARSKDIKFKVCFGTEVNPPLAMVLAKENAKMVAGYNAEIVINHGENGINWKINNERNIAAEAAAATSSVSNVIENAEEAFN